jgi:hypothetical protein
MKLSGWCRGAALGLLLLGYLGCALPAAPQGPPLSAAAARHTLDSWNPSYCKVMDFYGFYKAGDTMQTAYVLIANPNDKNQAPGVYEAEFRLLTLPEGQSRWFLTGLVTHGSGLTRRQGWDNLIIPVKAPPPAASK